MKGIARRRQDDPEDHDYSAVRHTDRALISIGGSVLALLLGSTGWLMAQDRARIEQRLSLVEQAIADSGRADARADARWEEVQRTLLEIKADVKEMRGRR